MRSVITVVIVALAVIYVGTQAMMIYKAKDDLRQRVKHYLDFVDEKSIDQVKHDLVSDAQKVGVTLSPDNIFITYQDTDIESLAQKIVGRKLGAQFKNKRVAITVRYTAQLMIVPLAEEVSEFKVVQVAAPVMPTSPAEQELLDN